MSDQPTVVALRVFLRKETRQVVAKCPICSKEHVHAWPYGEPEPIVIPGYDIVLDDSTRVVEDKSTSIHSHAAYQ